MKVRQKPFQLKNLIKQNKSELGLETFESSEIRRKMLAGTLAPGEQIWILRDRQSNPCNPVARVNEYAHVVIYIGSERIETEAKNESELHNIVHVALAPITKGLMKAKICKQNIDDVIKPSDQVFLGHRAYEVQYSANMHEAIKYRAEKCTEKPSILFDYHYK